MIRIFRIPSGQLMVLCGLLVEAAVFLAVARLSLFVLPFRTIAAFLDRPIRKPEPNLRERWRQRKQIRWAIERGTRFLPGETMCFPRGIAGFLMCRRRGIDSVLNYGAAFYPGEGLKAHVWLQDGPYGITGHSVSSEYCVLARFPAGARG